MSVTQRVMFLLDLRDGTYGPLPQEAKDAISRYLDTDEGETDPSGYQRRYRRAHPQSAMGKSFTKAHAEGWKLVAFNRDGYPIFRESTLSWLKRLIRRQPKFSSE
ncbi:hypothetical protein [Aureimonas sp. AU40]|uniref:hypothetical protein n=1 Tax=Aureimonas sp. AU40 TaxID=1637747 RepID=UPI000784E6B0|nr:hypothetical protein [Aureimonas sp. AU40]